MGTAVLEISSRGERYIVKGGDASDHHIARELRAHRTWLEPWTGRGRAAQLVQADDEAKLILTRFLPGELVLGSADEWTPETYRQAGELLAVFHAQYAVQDESYEAGENQRALDYLGDPHTIAPELVARLRSIVESWPTPAATLAPTHGDWQPRNWLIHDGVVSIIDFGRADLRPAYTDFARLAAQQFVGHPELERAFLDGYGSEPRDPEAWQRTRVREAISTAVWAHQIGDTEFEQQGHRMIAAALMHN